MSIRFGQLIQGVTYVRPPLEGASLRKSAITLQAPTRNYHAPALVQAEQVLYDCPEDQWGNSEKSRESFRASFVTQVGSGLPEEVSVWLRRNPNNPDYMDGALIFPPLQSTRDQIPFSVSLQYRQIKEDPKAYRRLKSGENIMIQDALMLRRWIDVAPKAAFEQIPAARTYRRRERG